MIVMYNEVAQISVSVFSAFEVLSSELCIGRVP